MGLDGTGKFAPAGQPGDCAGEAVAARFEADCLGYELGLGAEGVASIRLPVGRPRERLGVLAPEDEVFL